MKPFALVMLTAISLPAAELPTGMIGTYRISKTDIENNGKMLNFNQPGITGLVVIEKDSIVTRVLVGKSESRQTIPVPEYARTEDGIRFIGLDNRVNIVVVVDRDHLILKASKMPDGKSIDNMEVAYLEREPEGAPAGR